MIDISAEQEDAIHLLSFLKNDLYPALFQNLQEKLANTPRKEKRRLRLSRPRPKPQPFFKIKQKFTVTSKPAIRVVIPSHLLEQCCNGDELHKLHCDSQEEQIPERQLAETLIPLTDNDGITSQNAPARVNLACSETIHELEATEEENVDEIEFPVLFNQRVEDLDDGGHRS